MKETSPDLIIVGAGIVGVTIAHFAKRDFPQINIEMYSHGADPRQCIARAKGATSEGMDNRHASRDEGRVWGEEASIKIITPTTESSLDEEGGWDARLGHGSLQEESWVATTQKVARNPELREDIEKDLFALNQEGIAGHRKLMCQEPELFARTSVVNGVPMFFFDQRKQADFLAEERQYYPQARLLTDPEIQSTYPYIGRLMDQGVVTGGVVSEGFAIKVQTLYGGMLDNLENQGVRFHWNSEIVNLKRSKESGDVEYLMDSEGNPKIAPYLIVTPGVPTPGLFKGFEADGRIMQMVGYWTPVENLKIGGEKPRGDIALKGDIAHLNVTERVIDSGVLSMLSGGFGFYGDRLLDPNSPGIEAGKARFVNILHRRFPEIDGGAERVTKVCVRPVTATGLPFADKIPTTLGGKAFLVGGNGAAGYTQSPAFAAGVVEAMATGDSEIFRKFPSNRIAYE